MVGIALSPEDFTLLLARGLEGAGDEPLGGAGGGVQLLSAMEFIGVQSVFIVSLTGLFSGMVLALQTGIALARCRIRESFTRRLR